MAKRSLPIRTQDELALLLDRDKSQVSRYIRQENWPFSRRAPWGRSDVPRMLRWMADNLEPARNQGGTGETGSLKEKKTKEEIRKLHHQANAAELEYEKARGNVGGMDEIQRQMLRIVGVYVSQLQGLAASLAPILEGKNASEIHDEIEKAVSQVMADIRRGLAEIAGSTDRPDEIAREDAAERLGGEASDDAGRSDSGAGTIPE
jgi:hypothetical protein